MTGNTAKLSVIIASLYSRTDLENCLESVLANEQTEIEIIVADCCLKGKTVEWIDKYPAVNFIEFSEKTSLEVLLGAGIARAKGEIIAITDSSCAVADDWILSILRAHQTEESPVIGGAVEMPENSGGLTNWAAYFCDYGQFAPPASRGVASNVPGNNLSMKSWALAKGTEFVENEFWKTLWCRRLQTEDIELFSEPAISVGWRKTYRLIPFLLRRFHQGRCFAAMRVADEKNSKRILYVFGSIVLPLVFLFRIISPILPKRMYFGKLLLSLPIIILAVVFWSAGEALGNLAGKGKSCERIN